jgi:hypothetical protein
MSTVSYVEAAISFFDKVLSQECRVLTVLKDEEKWRATCEVVVDPEYTRRKGLGDVVEIYDVYFDERANIIGYELKATKRRAEIDE